MAGTALSPGETLGLVGETRGHLGCSLYLRDVEGKPGGPPPPVDLAAERRNGDFVRAQIQIGTVSACHDLSDRGLAVALAEARKSVGEGKGVAVRVDLGCRPLLKKKQN